MKNQGNKKLQKVMQLAWQLFKTNNCSFSECLKKAWANIKLALDLKHGICHFSYKKNDGTIRQACGTLMDLQEKIQGDRRAKNASIQVYFDTEKQEFRCFKKFNLVSINNL